MVKVTKEEIELHKNNFNRSNYDIPSGILNWPAQGDTSLGYTRDLAPFIDVNANGCYDPVKGDYPAIKGDEAIYWINYLIDGNPLPTFEYHYMLYSYYDSINTDLNNAVFLNYTLINRSDLNYDSIKVGLFMDSDLGQPWDDYVGCDSLTNTFYTYNGDNFDNPSSFGGYGDKIPVLGTRFLSDSLDGFMPISLYSQHGSITLDIHHYNYLNSNWPNGQPLTYGGSGYNTTGSVNQKTKYAFTGDPISNTGWTEGNPGFGLGSIPPGDRKMLGSIPYFSLAPEERKSIDLVFGVGYDSSHTSHLLNINDTKRVLGYAKQVYDSTKNLIPALASNDDCIDTTISVPELVRQSDFNLYPNPSNGTLRIETMKSIEEILLFDLTGNIVFRQKVSQLNKVNLNLGENLSSGIYFIQVLIEGTMLNKKLIIHY